MGPQAALAAWLRSLFNRQNDSLEEYSRLITAQEDSLRADTPVRFEAQLEVERALLDRLDALRRVSDALEAAYREAFPEGDPEAEAARLRVSRSARSLRERAPARRSAVSARQASAADQLRALRRHVARSQRPSQEPPQVLDILG